MNLFSKLDKGTKILVGINCTLGIILAVTFCVMFLVTPSKRADGSPNTHTKIYQQKKSAAVAEEQKIADDRPQIEGFFPATFGEESEKYSVYVFRPGIDETPIIFQSRPMFPASMVKMFVLAKAMQDVKDGKLSLDENLTVTAENIVGGAGSLAGYGVNRQVPVRLALELMIKESDNTATNILIDRIGMDNLNAYLREKNYTDTQFNHKMMKAANNKSNYTSVTDLGNLFTKIYNHECVDEYYDDMMINFLLMQEDKECLPAALPVWNIAHKTGEGDRVYHDGGICFGARGDFIIVLMNDNYEVRADTIDKMKELAEQVAAITFGKK